MTIIWACFGFIYWHSEQKSFGYFKHKDYGEQTKIHLSEIGKNIDEILGYLKYDSKRFLHGDNSKKDVYSPPDIALINKKHKKRNTINVIIAIGIIAVMLYLSTIRSEKQNHLQRELSSIKIELNSIKNNVDVDKSQLEETKKKLSYFKGVGNTEGYNKTVDSYNNLRDKTQKEIDSYNSKIQVYNSKIANK